MTKKEKELIEEITHLEDKLAHAETWMARQVAESSSLGKGLLDRMKKRRNLWDDIIDIAEKIRHFHLFRKHYTVRELWQKRFEAFLMGAAIILFWRGIWNLADHYLFPGHPDISAFTSLFIGMGLMIIMRGFVNQFLDEAVEEAE